jgi:hypothetical protein
MVVMMLVALGARAVRADDVAWIAFAPPSPLETDPPKLCGEIDVPRQHAAPGDFDGLAAACFEEIAGRLGRGEYSRAQNGGSGCLDALATHPRSYASLTADATCAAFDREIAFRQLVLKNKNSAERPASLLQQVRAQAAYLQDARKRCVAKASTSIDDARRERERTAATCPLREIRDLPSDLRTPAEQQRMAAEVAACTAEAQRRRAERAARLPALTLDDLLEIDEQYRTPEEQERIAKEAAARAEFIRKRQADPKWLGVALSGVICRATAEKVDLATEIRTEQKYAREYGGVVDKAKIYDLQQQIRERDEEISELRTRLRKAHATQTNCGAPLVKKVALCVPRDGSFPVGPECAEPSVHEHVEVAITPVMMEVP